MVVPYDRSCGRVGVASVVVASVGVASVGFTSAWLCVNNDYITYDLRTSQL